MRTVVGVFTSIHEAGRALADLERQGVSSDNTHLIAGNDKSRHDEYLKKSKEASTSTAAAAASGASFGGGMGIVASLVALAIPGVGPIIAGDAMLTVLTGFGIGAAAGGLLGTFKSLGISHEEAPLYEEAVRRGAVLAIAFVDDERAFQAVAAMEACGGRDIRSEVDTWGETEWSGPKTNPHPYSSDDSITSH
ncbi:MAG: hypothetical protein M3N93_02985 [Acidobacteriota bacterium]|nr:hypothetical protein [Acidobacteriota bacterium]